VSFLAEDDQLIEWLQLFDLSREEAKIYLALLRYKNLIVSELNSKIDFDKKDASRTYIYSFLRRMEGKWVHMQERRRKSSCYNPYPPREILAEVLEQKKQQQLDLEKLFPVLVNKLEKIHQEHTWDDIPPIAKRYVESVDIKGYFKTDSIRIETYELNEPDNQYLNLGLGDFSGFHVFRHKHTGTEDFVIAVNQFDSEETLQHRKDLLSTLLQLKVQEISSQLKKGGVIDLFESKEADIITIDGHAINRFRFHYRNPKYSAEIIEGVYFSFIPKNSPSVFVSIYANIYQNAEALLKWILQRSK
jgi:hypothetical protein